MDLEGGGGGGERKVLKWMLCRWHTFVLICAAGYQCVIHVFQATLSLSLSVLSHSPSPASSSIYSIDRLSLQRARWVSTSRWQVTACAGNVRSTATRRREPPSPAPATQTSTGRPTTLQQLPAPVRPNTPVCVLQNQIYLFICDDSVMLASFKSKTGNETKTLYKVE